MTSENRIPRWTRDLVLLTAIAFVAFGLGYLLLPEELAGWVDLAPRSPTALADLRAIYGGLPLAAGVLFLLGWRRPAWFAPCLFFVMLSSALIALSRIYSIAVSGMPGPLVLGFLALELTAFAVSWIAYRRVAS